MHSSSPNATEKNVSFFKIHIPEFVFSLEKVKSTQESEIVFKHLTT